MTALLLWLLSVAAAARLELSVDAPTLAVGETVAVQLQIVDGAWRGVPDVPASNGVSVRYQAQSQSTMMVNFKTTRIIRYTYALTGVAEGDWVVGPVRLNVGGEDLVSPAVKVKVGPRPAPGTTGSDLTGSLSDDAPFLGEVAVYRFTWLHRDRVLDARWTPPDFDGFITEKTAETNQREYIVNRDGADWSVQDIYVPLVAVGEGARVVGPAVLTAQVPEESSRSRRGRGWDPFADSPFGSMTNTRTITLSTDPISVQVRPLPIAGKPADFSGLVGRFSLKATPSSNKVPLGDSVTVEVEVAGTGTLAGYRLPALSEGSGFRAYDDEPDVAAVVKEGAFLTRATFRRAVVPEKEGHLTLPALRIPVFDPEAEAYVTMETQPIDIEVTPGEKGGELSSFATGAVDGRKDVAALGDDVLPVAANVSVGDRTLASALPLALGLPALPALGLLGLWATDLARRRRRDPWADLRSALGALPVDPTARLGALETLFREACGLRLGRPAPGLDHAAVGPLGAEADTLYGDLEAARYGGMSVEDLETRVRAFVGAR